MKAMAQQSWAQGEPLRLIELPTPEPRAGELRVRVQAIGVNPVDWKMRARGPLRLAARLVGPPPPVVFGVDFAGIVDAIGAGVTAVRVGDAGAKVMVGRSMKKLVSQVAFTKRITRTCRVVADAVTKPTYGTPADVTTIAGQMLMFGI